MAKQDPTDNLLDELLAGKDPEEILGKDGLLDDLTRRLVNRALEGEMTHHLGYPPHSPAGQHSGNSRNGKTTKIVKGKTGEMEIAVPRDRNGAFEPQLVKKHQRRLPGFDDKVVALYARGMTTREITGHLKELYGGHGHSDRGCEGLARPAARCGLSDRLPGRDSPEDASRGPGPEPCGLSRFGHQPGGPQGTPWALDRGERGL